MNRWTTFGGGDLLLDLTSDGRRRSNLEGAIRDAIRDGRLLPGTRMPSTRTLAADAGLSRGTVVSAYDQLIAEGWLVARQGSGTAVADVPRPRARPPSAAMGGGAAPQHDFRPGQPDPASFPRTTWLAATRAALDKAPDTAFTYDKPQGRIELREALADYLPRARGVVAEPERIVVTNGFGHALVLLAAVLRRRWGDGPVGLEDPSVVNPRQALVHQGFGLFALPVDGGGARVDALRTAPAGLRWAVLTPAHHFPLGVSLAPQRRAAATAWAREVDGLVVEDDYDGEFRYDRQPVGAVQALDPDRVAYVGTTSKSLAPGLRVGWMVLPPDLVEPVLEERADTDRHTGVVDQLVLAELLASGGFDRHLRRMRSRYRRRRDYLLERLADRVPAVEPAGIAAGLHVVLRLPGNGPSAARVVKHLAEGGVGVFDMAPSWHASDGAAPSVEALARSGISRRGALIVGYATPAEHRFRAAVAALVNGLERLFR